MSKSRGNTIDPNTIVDAYGADALRTYVLFMGEYGLETPWNDQGVKGISRFLDRVYRLIDRVDSKTDSYSAKFESVINKTIKKVTEDIDSMKYNTAISELMKLVNEYYIVDSITKADYTVLLTLLYPFAPHVTEELNEKLGNKAICLSSWPTYDVSKTVDATKEIAVQVNGKVRDTITISIYEDEDAIKEKAMSASNVLKHIEGKEIVKVIVIKGKIVNIVVK